MERTKTVRKAVIPVAGNGTRFLPATKAMPKEMLTIVDRPVVQYALDEAREAGIEHVVFVTSRNKQVIEDHFDDTPELISSLEKSGKNAQVTELGRLLPAAGAVSFTRQQAPLGLGHAVWCARDLIGDEPFALLLPDMISFGPRGCLSGLMDLFQEVGGNVVGVEPCAPEDVSQYGIVGKGAAVRHGFAVTEMVEKPRRGEAPSNFIITGRYVLQPEIFTHLAHQQRGAGNEIQLTDSMLKLSETQPFHAHVYEGRTYDCGSKNGFIEANVAFALARPDMGTSLYPSLRNIMLSHEGRIRAA